MKVKFPAIWFPAFKFKRGQLLNVNLFGVGFVIPPWDITFWEAVQLTPEFTLFDTDDLMLPVLELIWTIPQSVWAMATATIEQQINEYYEKHPEAKTK